MRLFRKRPSGPPTRRRLRRHWRRETLIGLALLPLSALPLYLFVSRTQAGQLMALKAQYELAAPGTPALPPAQVRLAASFDHGAVRGVPVLVYHGIGSLPAADALSRRFVVSRENFAHQMESLRAAGYRPIAADQLATYLRTGDPAGLPLRPVLITFDDGRTDAMLQADPILRDTGMRATMFVIGRQAEQGNLYYEGWSGLEHYERTGRWELESHTYHLHEMHHSLGRELSGLVDQKLGESLAEYRARVAADLDHERKLLEEHGAGRIMAFAYPFGDWGRTARPGVARSLGRVLRTRFAIAFDQDYQWRWRPALPDDDPMHLHRLSMQNWTGPELLRVLAAGERRSALEFAARSLGYTPPRLDVAALSRCPAGPHGIVAATGYGGPTIALTFNGTPSPQTGAILDELRRFGAHATFFVPGGSLAPYRRTLERIVAEGSQLGNGMVDGADPAQLPTAAVAAQIAQTNQAIRRVTGVRPCVVRPPLGSDGGRVSRLAGRLGLDTALWTVDPRDYAARSAGTVVARVLSAIAPGSIVLLSDGRSQVTVNALHTLLARLSAEGYRFGTIGELLAAGALDRNGHPFGG